jgi:hypothetical protein
MSFFSRQGFGRGNTKSSQNLRAGMNGSSTSPTTQTPPPMPNLSQSNSMSSNFSTDIPYTEVEPKKFFNEKYAKCSVKGNFLTLAAQPKNVELGEWLAHQRMFHRKRVEVAVRGLTHHSCRNEPPPHRHDPSYPRNRHEHRLPHL